MAIDFLAQVKDKLLLHSVKNPKFVLSVKGLQALAFFVAQTEYCFHWEHFVNGLRKKRALFKFQAKWKPKVLKHARFPAKALEQLHSLLSAIVLCPVCFRVVFAFENSVSFINTLISLHRKALGNLRMDANNSAAWHVSVCVFVHFCLCGCVGVWLGQGVRAGAITWGGCGEHKGGQIQQARVTRDHRRTAFPHLSVSKHPWKVIETSCPVLQYWYHKTWA